MKTPVLILSALLCTSCFKMPDDSFVPPVDVPLDFDWKTIESKQLVLNTVSSILNESGDTVASFLPAGTYDIVTGKGSALTVKAEAQSVQTKAGNNNFQRIYFPAKGKYATVMFEDLFPSKGDMDMNDVVFGLNIEYDLTNQLLVNSITLTIQPRAIGSSYETIGIAANLSYRFPIDIVDYVVYDNGPNVSGLFSINRVNKGYTPEMYNYLSQVIPLTGDYREYFDNDKDLFLNVRNIDTFTNSEEFSVKIYFKSSSLVSYSNFTFLDATNSSKVNLDLFTVFKYRWQEVHFKDQSPTERFNTSLFIATRPLTNFSTVDNWVWAIISEKSIRHPREFVKIYKAYPDFKLWAESSGNTNLNWYSNSVIDSLYTAGSFNYIN
ncbi:MAG: LruC domain-containing protein [Bacteroidales bacterium]|nr:LruC domain-containing protein [Bacteroidales bacterium]